MEERGQEIELPAPAFSQAVAGQCRNSDVEGYSKEPFPELGKSYQAAGLYCFPVPAGGKDSIVHPHCFKHAKSCSSYRPDSQSQFWVNILATTPPAEDE